MRPLNICLFNTMQSWGGGEKWHYETAILLKQHGFNIMLITSAGSELQKKLEGIVNIQTIAAGNLSFLNPFKILEAKKLLLQFKTDTVLMNLPSDLKLAGIAAKQAGIKNIIYRRGSALPIKNSILNRYLFGRILTGVIANSLATKKTILQNNPNLIDEKKITVIYNSVDVDALLQKEIHPFYNKQKDELVLAHAGRLAFEKNQRFLVDVAVILKAQQIPFKIILAGTGDDEAMLKDYAKSNDVETNIIFAGFISNVMDVISCCDVFVLPSLWEGFGYVLAEAALAEKPVVAFNLTSIPEIVLHKKTGLLTKKNDLDDFVSCVISLATHPELRIEYGRNGRAHVEATFSSKVINRELLAYLSK